MNKKSKNNQKFKYKKRGKRGIKKYKKNLSEPDFKIVTLKYSELLARAPGLAFDEYVFSANGGFDPNVTGTGAQPLFWDQYSIMYLRYYIDYSRIVIDVINTSSTSGMYLSVFPTGTATGATTLVDSQSQDYAHKTFIGVATGPSKAKLVNNITMSRIFGQSATLDDNFKAQISAQPVRQVYWVINAYSADLTSNLTYDLDIKIYYRVRFMQRFIQDLSMTKLQYEVMLYNSHVKANLDKIKNGPAYKRDINLKTIVKRDVGLKLILFDEEKCEFYEEKQETPSLIEFNENH